MTAQAPAVVEIADYPRTLREALDPARLGPVLAPISGGAAVAAVEVVEVIRTMATKVRFRVTFDDPGGTQGTFCLKAFLDTEDATAGGTTLHEADFYLQVAPAVPVRVPACVVALVNREARYGAIIMRDLIVDGARFGSALDPVTPDEVAQSLGQIATLHGRAALLDRFPWIGSRVAQLAGMQHITAERLQALLDGPRGEGLPRATLDAGRLLAGMKALAAQDAERPQTMVHGDAHAGNIYWTADGPGLIDWQILQRGGWALDVAYHINALLPVETAEREERRLLAHYLDLVRGQGGAVPDADEAWRQYRASALYGYFLWSITQRVEPAITNVFVNRLGSAVTRHESHGLLGIA